MYVLIVSSTSVALQTKIEVMDESSGLSTRMNDTIAAILPKIAATITERKSTGGVAKIDLSTAENWLLRPELVVLCKDAISQNLKASVRSQNLASLKYQLLLLLHPY